MPVAGVTGSRWPRRRERYSGVLSGGGGVCPGGEVFGAGFPGQEPFQCRAGERFPAVATAFVEVGGEPGQEVEAGHLGGGGDGPDYGGVAGGGPVMGAARRRAPCPAARGRRRRSRRPPAARGRRTGP